MARPIFPLLLTVKMACSCFSKKAAKITLGVSIVILLISIGAFIAFQEVYDAELKKDIALAEGGLVTKIWEDIPLPIYEKLYFFNITNKSEFMDGIEPLNVTEVGPYTFKSRWIKNATWNSNNTVSYREMRTYEFVPEMSSGSEDDSIFTLNGPLVVAANIVPWALRLPLNVYCRGKGITLVIRKTIRELAYEGYDDILLGDAERLGLDIPYKDGKFAWLYGKNASDDGLFTVFTGTDDESKTNFINNWNGNERLDFWDDDECNMLNGTSVETGPPIKGHPDSYTFFQSFFCRSVTFKYTEDVSHFDIPAKRFRPTRQLFANSTENPDNRCFEVNKEHSSGVLDISPCQFGAPVFISFPHFHLADPSYLNPVNGLNPSDDKHGSHIDVEPITGMSVNLFVRFQINLEIQKLLFFPILSGVTKGVLPVFWAELSLQIDEDLANFLKHNVRYPKIIAHTIISALFIISWVGIVASIIVLCGSTKEEDEQLILAKEQGMPSDYGGYEQDKVITVDENTESDKESSTALSINNPIESHQSSVVHVETPSNT